MKKLLVIILVFVSKFAMAQADSSAVGPDTVKVGAYVISVHDINFHDKQYTVRFWLWFLHNNTDFDFSKQLDIPNAKSIEFEEPIIDSVDGKQWVIMKMKCVMKQNWSVHDFPFDEQNIKVEIENTLFDNTSLVFVPDLKGSKFDEKEAIDGWAITDFKVKESENDYQTGFGDPRPGKDASVFSQFVIEMKLERHAWGLFLKIFVGMYIAFMIAVLSFTPHPAELEPRFGLPVGGLFAAVGNKYIIDSIMPESSAFTLADTLHALTFFSILCILIISAVALKLHDYKQTEKALWVNRTFSKLLVIGYVVLNVIFILVALF